MEPKFCIRDDLCSYPSAEHAYQAAKTLVPEERLLFATAATPSIAKRLGRKVTLRRDWEEVKNQVMDNICFQKFSHPELKQKLIDTGDLYLEETNTWGDTYWGVCDGKGRNILGLTLMKIRKEFNSEK